jgi:cGMP-dependent protein kinase
MTVGDSFGEQALYQNSVRGASVVAESEKVLCLALGRDTLTKILGDKIQVSRIRKRKGHHVQ